MGTEDVTLQETSDGYFEEISSCDDGDNDGY